MYMYIRDHSLGWYKWVPGGHTFLCTWKWGATQNSATISEGSCIFVHSDFLSKGTAKSSLRQCSSPWMIPPVSLNSQENDSQENLLWLSIWHYLILRKIKERRKDWLKSQLRQARRTKSMNGMRSLKMAPLVSRHGLQTASNKHAKLMEVHIIQQQIQIFTQEGGNHSVVVKMKRTTYRLMMNVFNL